MSTVVIGLVALVVILAVKVRRRVKKTRSLSALTNSHQNEEPETITVAVPDELGMKFSFVFALRECFRIKIVRT